MTQEIDAIVRPRNLGIDKIIAAFLNAPASDRTPGTCIGRNERLRIMYKKIILLNSLRSKLRSKFFSDCRVVCP